MIRRHHHTASAPGWFASVAAPYRFDSALELVSHVLVRRSSAGASRPPPSADPRSRVPTCRGTRRPKMPTSVPSWRPPRHAWVEDGQDRPKCFGFRLPPPCAWPSRDHTGDSSDRRLSLSDSQEPAGKPADPAKPQPTRPNPARDPEFRNLGYNPPARSSRHATWEAIPGRGGAHK